MKAQIGKLQFGTITNEWGTRWAFHRGQKRFWFFLAAGIFWLEVDR